MAPGSTPPVRGSAGVLAHVDRRVAQDPGALVRGEGSGHAGSRFLLAVPHDLPMRPIRAYAALSSAATPEARVELVMRELERQGAFSRGYIFVGAATGGGHVNPVALELVERMAGGDVASVSIQYGTRPSVLSIDRIPAARRLIELLIARIRRRIAQDHPAGGGPKVLLYGESLGGWATQDALGSVARRVEKETGRTADPLRESGVDTAVWVGIPGLSRFRRERLGPGGYQSLSAVAQLQSLAPAQRARARAWELSHFDDPVHRADLRTIWRRPAWLPRDGNNPPGVGPDERWRPVLTFLDTVRRALTSANQDQPGVWTDQVHDYRAALPQLLREAYGFADVSDQQLARISEQVRQSEVWIMSQEWA
jgi:uncharacterized membrane protein